MSNDIKNIIEKIRKLQQKTIENGCTENEVFLSAEKVNTLMQEYRIKEDQINFDTNNIMMKEYFIGKQKHPVENAYYGVEKLCGVLIYGKTKISYDDNYNKITKKSVAINGFEADVEQAKYLVHIIKLAIENEIVKFKKGTLYKNSTRKISLVNGFGMSMANAISDRLEIMANKNKWQTHKDKTKPKNKGKDLVVVKNGLIKSWIKEQGIRLTSSSSSYSNSDGFGLGKKAGNNVSLNKGVYGSANQRMIG